MVPIPPTSDVQPMNISFELETLSVLQLLPALMVVKVEHPLNMLPMSVTLAVLKPERSIEVSLLQPMNIDPILVTLAVFQFERSSEVRFWHNWNILFAFVISLVLTLVKSILVHCLKLLNSSVQSPVKLTWLAAVTFLTLPAITSLPHLLSLLNSPQMSASEPSVLL